MDTIRKIQLEEQKDLQSKDDIKFAAKKPVNVSDSYDPDKEEQFKKACHQLEALYGLNPNFINDMLNRKRNPNEMEDILALNQIVLKVQATEKPFYELCKNITYDKEIIFQCKDIIEDESNYLNNNFRPI